ncbi:unnamed protein product [Paramecium sonneborni]|uniref:WD40-repeat-containing domain n=1 Tax=Paramecium sonneborni TaxID=65129 RepID=A0A8S1PR12_9CILI|nr:unnamed protein product [Paramecium sonneborni]
MIITNQPQYLNDRLINNLKYYESSDNLLHHINQITFLKLRGGGCCNTKQQIHDFSKLNQKQIEENFVSNLQLFTNIIVEKSLSFQDNMNKDEILTAFQWFLNQKEQFLIICNEEIFNQTIYEVIEKILEQLLKQLKIYVKLSGFLFYLLLQICNDLFRIIFSYQLKNEERYMQEDLKKTFLEYISETECQIQVEALNIWINGVEFELQMIKTCIAHCRTNSQQGKELVLSIMSGLISSISQLKPSDELIDSLIQGGKFLLLNFYDKKIQNPIQIYEIYYFFENLKWSILNQLKLGYSIQNIIQQIQDAYLKYIKLSKDWMIHYCWINLISDIMCYRPIVYKNQLSQILQKGNQDQETWNQLIMSNQIVQLPYHKFAGKLKMFGNQNFSFKKFGSLKLFQEYLISNESNIFLLPNYVDFNFNLQKEEQLNDEDLFIQLLTDQSNMELIKSLIKQLKSQNEQILNNFEAAKQQINLYNSHLKNYKQFEIKILRQDIKFLMNQIKKSSLLLLFLIYEINQLTNKELQINSIIQVFLETQDSNQDEKQKILKKSTITVIKEKEEKYQFEFLNNFNSISQFWIQICQYTTISQEELININSDLEKPISIESQLNQNILILTDIINYLDKFLIQTNTIKRNFLNLLDQNKFKTFMKEPISQKNIAQLLIKLFNPKIISKLIVEICQYFQSTYKEKFEIQKKIDVQKMLFIICSNLNIYKGLKMILNVHHSKLLSISNQLQGVFTNKRTMENERQNQNDTNQYIKKLIIDKKEKLQILFNKYRNLEFTKDEVTEFNNISNEISLELSEINKKDQQELTKTHQILLLQDIQTKLELIGLVQQDKNTIQKEIFQLLDGHLYEISKDEKEISFQINDKQQNPLEEIIKLQSTDLFDCECQIRIIENLIIKSQKLKRIFKQNCKETVSQNEQTNQQLLSQFKNTFAKSLNQVIVDLQKQTIQFYQSINNKEQIIFNEEFMTKLQNQPKLNQKSTLIQVLNFNSLFVEDNEIKDQNGKINIIQNMLIELKKDQKIIVEKSVFDIFENSSYKVRELLVFNLVKMQQMVQEQVIQEFCGNLLKQIWMIEKHSGVRNLLKNDEMIRMQKKMFSKDLQNFSIKLKSEMQQRLKQIEQLETQVLLSDNQDEMKKQLQDAYDNFEIYLDNITDMSQRLDISLIFLREISKDLKNIKSSIDQVLISIKGVEDDIRRLRGKNFQDLFEIRKQKILKQKLENELDQVHIQFLTQEYDPISGNKKTNREGELSTFLIKNYYENYDGEVNEFLWSEYEKQKDVMIIKGKAGSGKSRASRNIEEFIWICDKISPNWIPIYVSLPSLKDPNHNLIEQALESENYNFDNIQIREFKEAVVNGNLKIVIILESYDEMKYDSIGTNLYHSNRFTQDLNLQVSGQTVKIIITTREEILNSIGYQTWFYGQNIDTLKEIEILPFTQEQSSQYIKKYVEISVKRTIKKFYEFIKQLKGQNFSLDEFKLIWNQLENIINTIILQQQNSEVLFQNQDVEKLILKIQTVEFFNFIKSNQMVSLKKELLQLWGEQKLCQVINNVNINHLLSTPFMMEIIVYVLPKMSSFFSQSNLIRDLLKKNFMILKREAKNSQKIIEKFLQKLINNQSQEEEVQNQKVIQTNVQNIELEILEQFTSIVEQLDNQNFFESFSIANSLEYINNTTIFSNKYFKVKIDANFIVSAFRLNQYTAFDFYEIFVNFYHNQQLQKLKDLGKSIKQESVLLDLKDFSIYLAIDMSQRQITQVNYKQKGKLFIKQAEEERKVEISWEDSYFSENQVDFEYKTLLLKCMLINSKGNIYSFNHKSIQEFFVAKYILDLIEKIFIKENQRIDENIIYKSSFNKDQFNLSFEHYSGTLELLKPKIKQIENIKQKLIQITQLSNIQCDNKKYIRSASNCLYILSFLGEYLDNIDLSNICISDTKLNGLSFYKCNLNNSQFDNISIDSCNLNCATIENANWNNLICKEKPSLIGHKQKIIQIVFSDDGNTLISGSEDGIINIWQVYSDEEKQSINLQKDENLITITFSKVKNLLACLTQNNIYLFNTIDLNQLSHQQLINNDYIDILLSPNGKYLAAQTNSGQIHFWLIQHILQQSTQQQKHISKEKNQGLIYSITISSDYQLIATGGFPIKVWKAQDITDIQEILELPKQLKPVFGVAFSKDNQILATGGENKKLEFWNIQNLNQIQLIFSLDSQQNIEQVSYSNDGNLIALRSTSQLKLYDVSKLSDQQDYFIIHSQFKVDLIEISYDCYTLACSQKKNPQEKNPKIKIWDIRNLHHIKMLCIFEEHKDDVLSLKFTNDNLVLGSGSLDMTICLWDLNKQKLIVKLSTHTNRVLDLAFSSNRNQMVSCSLDKTIIFWDITNLDQPLNQITLQQQIESNKVIFWPNKQIVVSFKCQHSKEIQFWNSIQFNLISSIQTDENFLDINFNQDGEVMISLSEKGIVRIWKINEQSFLIEKQIQLKDLQYLKRIFYLNSQNIIVQSHVSVFLLKIEDNQIQKHHFHFQNNAYCISVAYNQQFIVIGSTLSFEIIIIENHNSPNMMYLQDNNNSYKDFQFSNDSSLLAIATEKGSFIYNIKINQIEQKFEENCCCISISFIGNEKLAIGKNTLGGQLVLYDIQNSQSIQQLAIIQLPNNPLKILFSNKLEQIVIYCSSVITVLKLSELESIQLIQMNKCKKSKDIILDSNQQYIGIGIENHICFYSLLDTIKLDKILKSNQENQFLHKNFSLNSNFFTVISNNSIYTKYDINENKIIKQINLNLSPLSLLTLNYQESQLVAIQELDQGKQKSLLMDLESTKVISCFEEIDDEKKFKCKKVIFSQDGQNFVSSYVDLTIKLWDAKSCKLLSMFKSDTSIIELINISTKGILAQTSEQIIKLWNLKALQQSFEMDGHSDSVKQLSISSDGFQLVTGSEAEIIRWDLIELKKIDVLLKGKRLPSSFCFSMNCQYFAALDDEQTVHIWKLNTKYIIEHHFKLQCIFNDNLAFSINQTQLICKYINSKVLILNLEQVSKQKQLLNQSNLNVQSRSIILSSNLLIKSNPLEVIRTNNKSELINENFEGIQLSNITTIAICPISQRLAIEDKDYSIIIWSMEKKQKESVLQHLSFKNTKVLSMTFSGNGKLLFSCHIDEKIRLWNINNDCTLITIQDLQFYNNSNSTRQISSLQIFPIKDEKYIVIWSEDYQFWDVQISQLVFQIDQVSILEEQFNNGLLLQHFSIGYSDKTNLAAIQFKTNLKLYDITSKQQIATLEGNSFHKQSFSSILIFSENGNSLLSLGRNHTIRFWDLSNLNTIKLKVNLVKPIEASALQFLNSTTVRLFSKFGDIIDENLSEYQEVAVIENENSFDFNSIQRELEVCKYICKIENKTLNIFDSQNNELKFTLNQFNSQIKKLQFTLSEDQFILGMEDGSILLYKIDQQTLKNYEYPVCYYVLSKSPLLQAYRCNIRQSKFQTIENENFQKLLVEKGALK